jgi:multiple sugar transport system substrate-binding protein
MDGIKTWNDFFSAAEKMTNKSAKQYGVAIRGGAGGAKFLERQMYAYSGILSLFDENGKCTINDPKHVEFVERYFGMYKKYTSEGDLNYGWTELSAAFDSGHAGMIIHNLGSAADHVKAFNNDLSKFAAIGMPLNDKGTSVNLMLQPGGLTISSTCKYPEEAFNFIKFMTTGDAVSEYAQKWGVIPIDTTVLQSASWVQDTPWFKASADLLLNPNTLFYNQYAWLPGRNPLYNQVDTDSQYVMTGQMTAKEMLDKWAKACQESYDKVMGK